MERILYLIYSRINCFKQLFLICLLLVFSTVCSVGAWAKPEQGKKIQISGLFTCDNAYQIWVGDKNRVRKKLGKGTNWYGYNYVRRPDRLRPRKVDLEKNSYLYIIAWSDDDGYQGFIGSFTGAFTLHSGDSCWQVLPTGINKKWPRSPRKSEINKSIANAISSDWKAITCGARNGGVPWKHIFPEISKSARWMWYDSGSDKRVKYPSAPYVPFVGHNHNEFLIFRAPIPQKEFQVAQLF